MHLGTEKTIQSQQHNLSHILGKQSGFSCCPTVTASLSEVQTWRTGIRTGRQNCFGYLKILYLDLECPGFQKELNNKRLFFFFFF